MERGYVESSISCNQWGAEMGASPAADCSVARWCKVLHPTWKTVSGQCDAINLMQQSEECTRWRAGFQSCIVAHPQLTFALPIQRGYACSRSK
jgi:hypothetical protein